MHLHTILSKSSDFLIVVIFIIVLSALLDLWSLRLDLWLLHQSLLVPEWISLIKSCCDCVEYKQKRLHCIYVLSWQFTLVISPL